LLRGGARVFGPKPRDYRTKLNKKVKVLARKSALSYKAQEDAIVVVEDFSFEAPKTKEFLNITKNLKVDGKKVLMLLPETNKNVYLSARNLQRAEVLEANKVNAYKILNADVLVITENSLKAIDEILNK
jgi:large subunit ribosomal protein L4